MYYPGLFILGETGNERGVQLERLTVRVLESIGYSNIVSRIRGSGGDEVDVTARRETPDLGDTRVDIAICECKALRDPVDITDWLKFLGKIYAEENIEGKPVRGFFIALSGVNGSVAGHYKALIQRQQNVKILSGEELLGELNKVLPLTSLEDINTIIHRYTNRQYQAIATAYYNDQVYRVPIFEDGSYTVLDSAGAPLSSVRAEALTPLIELAASVFPYIDLLQEAEAAKRAERAKKWVLSKLMLLDGATDRKADLADQTDVSDDELERALQELEADSLLTINQSGRVTLSKADPAEGVSSFVRVMRAMVVDSTEIVEPAVFGCSYYDRHITDALVLEIGTIQADIPFPSKYRKQVREIIRLSPSALLSAIHPQDMLTRSRVEQPFTVNARTDDFARKSLMLMLCDALERDHNHGPFMTYFLDVRGVRELEIDRKFVVKSDTKVIFSEKVKSRVQARYADENAGGRLWHAAVIDDLAQPWENLDVVDDGSQLT